MMLIHESGHVLAAWLSGGRVRDVVWHPLQISRTDLAKNPHPLFVVFAGPVWGSAMPIGIWLLVRWRRWQITPYARAFAGFCLIANGAYLATAVFMPVGDTEDMLRLGTPAWLVSLCGTFAVAGGLALWNGLGPQLRLRHKEVSMWTVLFAAATLFVLLAAMLLWSYAR